MCYNSIKKGGVCMAYSESQKRASRKYNENNYDRLFITVPKGKKDEYKAKAESEGKSLNQYIIDCIERG